MHRTILILTSHTGGGHDTVATALAQALMSGEPGHTRVCLAAPLGALVDRTYIWMLNHATQLWGCCYRATNAAPTVALAGRLLGVHRGRSLARLLLDERPDLVLSVHPLCAQLAARAMRRLRLDIPHHCVITDLVDVHQAWIAPDVAVFYVPTQLAGEALLRRGVAPGRVLHTGMPLRRAFWPGSIQQGLADDAQHDTIRVLVMDGGAPGPALGRAARALLAAGLPLSLSLAWGRSTPARLAVPDGPCTVRHLTWDASIAAEMSIADLVVTKAGSVSIAEALALGRPIVIHRVVPGQESSNPGYLQASGAGCAALSPAELVRWVRHLAAEPYRRAMATSARELGRPSAALKVAMHVLTALGERAVSEAAG